VVGKIEHEQQIKLAGLIEQAGDGCHGKSETRQRANR